MSTTGNTIVFPVNGVRSMLYPSKNVILDSYIPLFTKVIFTWFVDLNVKDNTIKFRKYYRDYSVIIIFITVLLVWK